MMPQLSEPAVEVTGGSTATTMRVSSGRAGRRLWLMQAALPQAVHAFLDDLAFELLPADRRIAVAALHLGEERRRQVAALSAVRERVVAVACVLDDASSAAGRHAAWW